MFHFFLNHRLIICSIGTSLSDNRAGYNEMIPKNVDNVRCARAKGDVSLGRRIKVTRLHRKGARNMIDGAF